MTKTQLTKDIEEALWKDKIERTRIMGCFEVTIGWDGSEIVDFLTYDFNTDIRCYEIKTSVADYNSRARITHIGDYNYYVFPINVYEQIKEKTWKNITNEYKHVLPVEKDVFDRQMKGQKAGVILFDPQTKILFTHIKPKRKNLDLPDRIKILQSLVRSQNREIRKFYKIKGYWEK